MESRKILHIAVAVLTRSLTTTRFGGGTVCTFYCKRIKTNKFRKYQNLSMVVFNLVFDNL